MPTARRCQGCGATLGEPAAGATVVTCQFCGLAHDATAAAPAFTSGPVVVQYAPGSRAANRILVAVVLLAVAVITAGALVQQALERWGAKSAIGLSSSNATARPNDGKVPIAPPELAKTATCPQCGSTDTEEVSRFGSTPCKAQWRCKDCMEPFDRFKCH